MAKDDILPEAVDLIYLFPERPPSSLVRSIHDSFRFENLERYFRSNRVESSNLSPDENHYIREPEAPPPNEHGLKSGPNSLFYHTVEKIGPAYHSIIQMETDCVPVREGWLRNLRDAVLEGDDTWVLGTRNPGDTSALAVDGPPQRKRDLPDGFTGIPTLFPRVLETTASVDGEVRETGNGLRLCVGRVSAGG